MKKVAMLAAALSCSTTGVQAESFIDEFEAHGFFQIGTNHVWRGISFSQRAPEIFGAMLITHPVGFYAGTIVFNSFLSDGGYGGAPIIGYANKFHDLEYDISVRHEHYPKKTVPITPDISEAWLKLGYPVHERVKVKAEVAYSPDYYLQSGAGWYYAGRVELNVPCKIMIDAGVGHQTTSFGALSTNAWFKDHTNWDAGISKDVDQLGVTLGFRYTDTDLNMYECNGSTICKPAYNLYAKKSF